MGRNAGRGNSDSTTFIEGLEARRLMTVIAPVTVSARVGYREGADGATTRAHVSWTDNNVSETGYRVEFSDDGVGGWTTIGADRPANSAYAIQILDAGQKYFYRVRAVEGTVVSEPSVVFSPTVARDRAVELSATVTGDDTTVNWPLDPDAVSYQVWRKPRAATTNGSWQLLTSTPLPPTSTGYTDSNGILPGLAYEYQVTRVTRNFYGQGVDGTSYGYVFAGSELPMVHDRGTVLLVVDDSQAPYLETELVRFKRDLIGDGWHVQRLDLFRDGGSGWNWQAAEVKSHIQAVHRNTPGGLKSIVLIGHLPVPYSGTVDWDGHPEHVGAWAADSYYGENLGGIDAHLDGRWTDTAFVLNPHYPENQNVPRDDKFDQNTTPGKVDVPVGRIDFADLPGMRYSFNPVVPTVDQSETLLLKRYFDKDHAWRTGQVSVMNQALIDDHLGGGAPEGAWRTFAPLVGPDKVYGRDWEDSLHTDTYLWAYGAGPGSNDTAAGVTTIFNFHSPESRYNAAFTLLFGSWFGDWDKQSNLLREMVATNGAALVAGWAGTPNWYLHTTGLGEPVGAGLVMTQNNGDDGAYGPATGGMRGAHISLIGDPTLRTAVVKPVKQLTAQRTAAGNKLAWQPPADASVLGYYVYRATSADGPFTLITPDPVNPPGTLKYFTDTSVVGSNQRYTYMVRALKPEFTPSGVYYNGSTGQFAEVGALQPPERDVINPVPYPRTIQSPPPPAQLNSSPFSAELMERRKLIDEIELQQSV